MSVQHTSRADVGNIKRKWASVLIRNIKAVKTRWMRLSGPFARSNALVCLDGFMHHAGCPAIQLSKHAGHSAVYQWRRKEKGLTDHSWLHPASLQLYLVIPRTFYKVIMQQAVLGLSTSLLWFGREEKRKQQSQQTTTNKSSFATVPW
jgi:hypothetical protein